MADDFFPLPPGTRLGDYEILGGIGHGGMGTVYRARHVNLLKHYALKVLPEAAARDPHFIHRFRQEAKVMAELDHPNIVRVTYLGEQDTTCYLVMDLVTNEAGQICDLEEYLRQAPEGRLPHAHVRDILLQVCQAVAYAHSQGVIHRDLKPSNVLLGPAGLVKVSDFGLARIIGEKYLQTRIEQSVAWSLSLSVGDRPTRDGRSPSVSPTAADASGVGDLETRRRRTTSGSILGTWDYMSPEQRAGRPADQRSDIYSLGVMAYRMLVGRLPTRTSPSPSSRGAPRDWDRIIDRCLQEAPADRYPSVLDLIADISRIGRPALGRFFGPRVLLGMAVIAVALLAGYIVHRLVGGNSVTPECRERAISLLREADRLIAAGRLIEADRKLEEAAPLKGCLLPTDPSLEAARTRLAEARQKADQVRALMKEAEKLHLEGRYDEGEAKAREAIAIGARLETGEETPEEFLKQLIGQRGKSPQEIRRKKALELLNVVKQYISEGRLTLAQQKLEECEPYKDALLPTDPSLEAAHTRVAEARQKADQVRALMKEAEKLYLEGRYDEGEAKAREAIAIGARLEPGEKTPEQLLAELKEHKRKSESGLKQVKLPEGFIPTENAQYHASGWPLSIRCQKDGATMVFVPAGEFPRGSDRHPGERPKRAIRLRAYYIDEHEVTAEQFCRFLNAMGDLREEGGAPWVHLADETPILREGNAFKPRDGCAQKPIVNVTWYAARAYALWTHRQLPTEAQWEKAARGTDEQRLYPWGPEKPTPQRANFLQEWTSPMDTLADAFSLQLGASPFGCLHLAGNVAEWCEDWFEATYYEPTRADSPSVDPRGPQGPENTASRRVVRGGSWYDGPELLRCSSRTAELPHHANPRLGFRCVLDLEKPADQHR